MAAASRSFLCKLQDDEKRPAIHRPRSADQAPAANGAKLMLQPRLCNLRSYSSDRAGVMIRMRKDQDCIAGGGAAVSSFFASLSEYIETSRKSHDFEIIAGRLAMMAIAVTGTTEVVTGNSVFKKMDVQWIEEATAVCVTAVASAAAFAWLSKSRGRVGRVFAIGCNYFIDSLIDKIVDGLFYESELSDWSDEI